MTASIEQLEQAAYEAACGMERFTVYRLSAQTHVPVETVRRILKRWTSSGRVVCEGLGRRHRKVYRMTDRARIAHPTGNADWNMWRSARMLGQFTAVDIQMHSNTASAEVSAANAHRFCTMLLRGGYLRVVRKAVSGRHPAMYRLIRDTGPKPPVERRVRAIWDPNTREFAHVAEPSK